MGRRDMGVHHNNRETTRDLPSQKYLHHIRDFFLGHVARSHQIASTLLTAWLRMKRPKGHPRCTARSTTLQSLREVLPDTGADGELSTWIRFTQDPLQWSKLIRGKITPDAYNFSADSGNPHDTYSQPPPQSPPRASY